MRALLPFMLLCAQVHAQIVIGGFTSGGGSAGGGGGTTETGTNLGAGTFYFFKQKSGTVFQFHTFDVTSPIVAALAADKITFTCPTCLVSTGSYSAPSWLTGLQPTSEKNAANGYAGLTAGTKLTKAHGDEIWALADLSNVTGQRGNATVVQMAGAGTPATNDCAKFDSAGNLVSAGAACGTGGGGGTPGGSNGQVQYNNAGAFGGLGLGFGLRINGGSLEVNPSTVPTYLTATAALNFASISASACSELTITLTGAAVGDAVIPSYPNAMEAGLLGNMFVSATNTVTVRLCKITTGSVDPADANFTATIVRSF